MCFECVFKKVGKNENRDQHMRHVTTVGNEAGYFGEDQGHGNFRKICRNSSIRLI